MPIVIFAGDSVAAIGDGVSTNVEFWIGEAVGSGVSSGNALSTIGTSNYLELGAEVDDASMLSLDAEVAEYWNTPVRSAKVHTYLMHRNFGNIECKYSSVSPGTIDSITESWDGRLPSRLPSITDTRSLASKSASMTNTSNCFTTQSPDGSKVVIIDPLSDIVKLLDSQGNTISKEALPMGTFAEMIAITADNEHYWLLVWESDNYHGGAKYSIHARRWEDNSLVEYEWLGGAVTSEAFLAEDIFALIDVELLESKPHLNTDVGISEYDQVFTDVEVEKIDNELNTDVEVEKIDNELNTDVEFGYDWFLGVDTFLDSTHVVELPAVLILPEGAEGVHTDVMFLIETKTVVTDVLLIGEHLIVPIDVELALFSDDEFACVATDVEISLQWGISSDVALEEIRIELRFPTVRRSQVNMSNSGEYNYVQHMFNAETEINRVEYIVAPTRTKDQRHEQPFSEESPHYYGHPFDYQYAEENGFALEDAYITPSVGYSGSGLQSMYYPSSRKIYNTRHVTAPQIAATETKLIFAVVRHRGAFPWRDNRYAVDHPRHRSSQTLLMEIDKTTRWVSSIPKNVNMSGAQAFVANDDIGLVMADSFWPMGSDGKLISFFDNFDNEGWDDDHPNDYVEKFTDIVRFDLSFTHIATKSTIEPESGYDSPYITKPLVENRADGRNASTVRIKGNWKLATSFKKPSDFGYSNGIYDLNTPFNDYRHTEQVFNSCLRVSGDSIVWVEPNFYIGMYLFATGDVHDTYISNSSTGEYTGRVNLFYEFDGTLTETNKFLSSCQASALLAYRVEDVQYAISSDCLLLPHTSWHYMEVDASVHVWGAQGVSSDATVTISEAISTDIFLDTGMALAVDCILTTYGHKKILHIISNSSPNELRDKGTAYLPVDHMGTYPFTTRFWSIGTGEAYNDVDEIVPAWYIDNLHNPVPANAKEVDETGWAEDLASTYPYPIQYVTDNENGVIFGLYRATEGHNNTGLVKYYGDGPIDNNEYHTYTDGGFEAVANKNSQNLGMGAWIHKYDTVNSMPTKSIYIPGYLHSTSAATYDPFTQIRYIGTSPTNKRIYVIRAYGRRDYFSALPWGLNNVRSPFLESLELGLNYVTTDNRRWNFSTNFDKDSGFYVSDAETRLSYVPDAEDWGGVNSEDDPYTFFYNMPWFTDESTMLDSSSFSAYMAMNETTGLRGFTPSDNNAATLNLTNTYPHQSAVKFGFTITALTGEDSAWADNDNDYFPWYVHGQFNPELVPLYEQTANIYDVRDILVYNYDLELVTTISSIRGLEDNDVILHVVERDSIFYVLTQAAEAVYNWAAFNARRAIDQPVPSTYQDDKYGYCYRKTRIYTVTNTMNGAASLLYEFPWAGHSVGDTLIQEVTDTHIWLNWSGVHTERAGSFLGVGVKLDGSGYIEVPGLIALIKGHYGEDEEWHALCYTNTSQKSPIITEYTHPYTYNTTAMRHSYIGDKFPRWGDGRKSKLSVLTEADLGFLEFDVTNHEYEEHWFKGLEYMDEAYELVDNFSFYLGGTQPGYSQVVNRIYYDWVITDVSLRETVESLRPTTWIKTTTGGPNTLEL